MVVSTLKSGNLEKYCQELFKEKIGIENDRLFQRIWRQSIDSHCIRFDRSVPLTELQRQIEIAIGDTLFYHGKGVDFSIDSSTDVSRFVRYLLGKGTFSFDWIHPSVVKAIALKKDPQLLKSMRDAFRAALIECSRSYPERNSKEEKIFQTFVGNVIALLPYGYPEVGEHFTIPMLVDGKWKNVDYAIDQKIELTHQWFSSPIDAFGLTSKDGPPLLTFLGTSYPTGEGFVATLLADCTPGLSVGHAPYLQGKRKIAEWLRDKTNVRLYGMSLGGALALHTARKHPDKISLVEAFNPPGLYPWDWSRAADGLPQINIYSQNNDLVSTMGMFPRGESVSIYRVIGDLQSNFINSHARIYSGSDEVTFLKSSPAFENHRIVRQLLTSLHILCGFLIFIPVLLIHLLYCITIRPFAEIISLIQRHTDH
jgi:hypothetical protein